METGEQKPFNVDRRFFNDHNNSAKVERDLPEDFDKDAAYYGDMEQWKKILSEKDYLTLKDVYENYLRDPSEMYELVFFLEGVYACNNGEYEEEWESCYIHIYIDYNEASADDTRPEGYRLYHAVWISVALKATQEEKEKWLKEVYGPWAEKRSAQEAQEARKDEAKRTREKVAIEKIDFYSRYKDFGDGIIIEEYDRSTAILTENKHLSQQPNPEHTAILSALERILAERNINPKNLMRTRYGERPHLALPSIPPSREGFSPPSLTGLSLEEQRRALDDAWKKE
ncbi:hypothetical protein HY732_05090 [Candidatus Uhrbacteria bacterium]|nr:hypothetical protein [Candidatus Uhrbacteria bacterium]